MRKKIVLMILDGWGIRKEKQGNAILNARTPNINKLMSTYPTTALQASGISVGLPFGKVGNSEVGHSTIGMGRVLYQNILKVTLAIQNRSFFQNPTLLSTVRYAKSQRSNIHLMGLVSNGGVHSHIDHLYAILDFLKEQHFNPEKVFIHFFADGRDVSVDSGINFASQLQQYIKSEGFPGRIASVMGREYAMDKNECWIKTQKAYYALASGAGLVCDNVDDVFLKSYHNGITDEFIEPTFITNENGSIDYIKTNDAVIFFNIRDDRARQLTQAFTEENFTDFERGNKIPGLYFTNFVECDTSLDTQVVFPMEETEWSLGQVLSEMDLRQLRIAETEKYAHVTYFFNGGKEVPFRGEHRLMIPSPKVSNYVSTPHMSAEEITKNVISYIEKGSFDFILVNFSNPDILGHTGNLLAAIQAVEYLDECVGKIYEKILAHRHVMIITSDHGNAEEMINLKNGHIITEHTSNPVPFILVDPDNPSKTPFNINDLTIGGMLSDIAPTILELMKIPKPKEMTGVSLLDSI